MKAPGRHLHKIGHGPVNAISESEAFRFQVVEAPTNKRRVCRKQRRGFADDLIALFEAADAAPKFGHRP